jgi:hypothetical protein
MAIDTRPFNTYDTVEVTSTHPIQELHGAAGKVALPLCHSILVRFHTFDRHLRPIDLDSFSNFGPFCRIERRHLHNRNVPPIPDDPLVGHALAKRLAAELSLAQRLPLFAYCPVHTGAVMFRRIKGSRAWYSHKVTHSVYPEGFHWCPGYLRWYEEPAY